MSADNYYLVRRAPHGRFAALMGFASNGAAPTVFRWPTGRAPVEHETADAALESVVHDYAEYGASIHPECDAPPTSEHDRPLALAAVANRLRDDLEFYGAQEESVALGFTVAVDAMRTILAVEAGQPCPDDIDPDLFETVRCALAPEPVR